MSTLNLENRTDTKNKKIFGGETDGIQRFDEYKYPRTKELEELQRKAIWDPAEINFKLDKTRFKNIPIVPQTLFKKVISFQTLMDSEQNSALDEVFASLITSEEWSFVIKTQAFFEGIHSLSYARNLIQMFSIEEVGEIYDEIHNDEFIKHRIDSEIDIYNQLKYLQNDNNDIFNNLEFRSNFLNPQVSKGIKKQIQELRESIDEHFLTREFDLTSKKTILEAVIRINVLEGIKFYLSFLITYKINSEYGNSIPGSSNIIQMINFDEDFHVVIFQFLTKVLREEEHEQFVELFQKDEEGNSFFSVMAREIFEETYQQELEWGNYLSSFHEIEYKKEDGEIDIIAKSDMLNDFQEFIDTHNIIKDSGRFTIPGLTLNEIDNFLKYYIDARLKGIDEPTLFDGAPSTELVKWFKSYKSLNNKRVALQESDLTAYTIGALEDDIEESEQLLEDNDMYFTMSDFENN